MLSHVEFTFKIIAPTELKRCIFRGCTLDGTYAAHVSDDRGATIAHYDPLCEMHLLFSFVESFNDALYGKALRTN